MKIPTLLSNLWKSPKRRVSEASSYLFDDQLTEASMKSANPSASEWAIFEECFGLKGKVGPAPSAAAPTRRRKIA